jgi:hypothetical protein
MSPEEFVRAIVDCVRDPAVADTLAALHRPPGRRPAPEDVALSDWFAGLSSNDQARVEQCIKSAADSAVFGFFCVLDGVRVIENRAGEKGEFGLTFSQDGAEHQLVGTSSESLHDIYRASDS